MRYEVVEWEDDNYKKFKSIIAFSKEKGVDDIKLMTIQIDLTQNNLIDMSLDIKLFEALVTRLKSRGEMK